MSRRAAGLRPAVATGMALFCLSSAGCLSAGGQRWGAELTDTEHARVSESFPPRPRPSCCRWPRSSYARITSRRFNSRATFEDPSIRQFFPTIAAYSDYYAALVDALDRAYIRYNRPTRVELLGIDLAESGNLLLEVRFVGRNDLPLRWWSTSLVRQDEWTWRDGRWYVVPGKV